MNNYELNKKDFNDIKNLIKITSSIDNLYNKLYDIELLNKKNSDEYKKLVDYLNIAVDIENKKYNELNLSNEKVIAWIEHIIDDLIPDSFTDNIESVMAQNYNNRIIRRILNNLLYKNNHSYNDIPNEIINKLNNITETKLIDKCFDYKIYKGFEIDILYAFLFLLEKVQKDPCSNCHKKEFINAKYNIIFNNKVLENFVLNNNFILPINLISYSILFANLDEMNEKNYNILKDEYITQILIKNITEIITIADKKYNDQKQINTCLLRYILMCSIIPKTNYEILNAINNEIKKIKFLNKSNKISLHLISSFFNITKTIISHQKKII